MREVTGQLIRRQIDVREHDGPEHRLLENLRAPAGLGSRIKPFATGETELLEDSDGAVKPLARCIIRMMVVVGPSDPEYVLSRFLHSGGMVAATPVLTLRTKEKRAGPIRTEIVDRLRNDRCGVVESACRVIEQSPAPTQAIEVPLAPQQSIGREVGDVEANVSVALDDPALDAMFAPHTRAPIRGQRLPVDLCLDALCGQKIRDGFDSNGEHYRLSGPQYNVGKDAELVNAVGGAVRCMTDLETRLHETVTLARITRHDDMIQQIGESNAGCRPQPLREVRRLRASPQRIVDDLPDQRVCSRLHDPAAERRRRGGKSGGFHWCVPRSRLRTDA